MNDVEKTSKTIFLAADERITAVVPEFPVPGEAKNMVAWVYIANSSGEVRIDSLLFDEMPWELLALSRAAEALNKELVRLVKFERKDKNGIN